MTTRLFIELCCSELVGLLIVCTVDPLMNGPVCMVVPKFWSTMGICEICTSTYAGFSPQLSFIYINYKVNYICILCVIQLALSDHSVPVLVSSCWSATHTHTHIYIYIYICVCVWWMVMLYLFCYRTNCWCQNSDKPSPDRMSVS
jgi:hypothetical protein